MPAFVTVFLSIIQCILRPHHSLTITKNAFLNENILQQNGATITKYAGIVDCTNAICWALYADDVGEQDFHLKLALNSSWGFHPAEPTTLKIEIRYNKNTNWCCNNGHDLVVVFSQSGTNKYFANLMHINTNDGDHGMYPQWTLTNEFQPYPDYETGDVESLVAPYTEYYDRWYKLTKGSAYYTYYPPRSSNERNVQSPLTFTLQNYPSNYMLYSYTNPGILYYTFSVETLIFIKKKVKRPELQHILQCP